MNYLKLSIVIVQQDIHLPDAAADTINSPACGHCKTENYVNPNNNQEIVEEGDTDN